MVSQSEVKIATDTVLKEMDAKVQQFIDRVFEYSQRNLIQEGKVDTGTLLKTGNVERELMGGSIIYPVPYADVIENGRDPGTMPPVEPIQRWVQRKLGIKDLIKSRQVAFAIATQIKKRGLVGTRFLRDAVDQAESDFS